MNQPLKFLNLAFHEINDFGDDLTLCAGFERSVWRSEQFAEHIIEWLPEFALNYTELNEITHHNAVRMIKKAAQIVYQTEKYGSRGEFGEILLHIAIRQVYKTLPAITKIYYKSAVNETVKGFDAVHVVRKNNGLELWIGETKFYKDVTSAIYEVCNEIVDHLETKYLRSEFILITNKIDPSWPEAENLKGLLNNNNSLDEVFQKICIPVLLTYESDVVRNSKQADEKYKADLKAEVEKTFVNMRNKLLNNYKKRFNSELSITVHVILVPLNEKQPLTDALNYKLKALQAL